MSDPTVSLHHSDCLDVVAAMDAGSVDAVCTDPPYGLVFMGKDWDHGIPGVHFWQAAHRVLKPSCYLLAFGGTRTWHRLACAIEDAGFEIRDTLMWLYGSGFPKGKSCLKPAWEPIILARKPGPMRELGIEECRIAHGDDLSRYETSATSGMGYGGVDSPVLTPASPAGRWPANLILNEEAGAMLDGQTAGVGGGLRNPATCTSLAQSRSVYAPIDECTYEGNTYGESGGASRFFFQAKGDGHASSVDSGGGVCGGCDSGGVQRPLGGAGLERFLYCAKASRSERNAGCEGAAAVLNHHPTVKPLALMRWLVKLVARPGDVVLDPFMGSGTTGVACVMEGREFIGVEREAEYLEIARRRIEAASAQTRLTIDTEYHDGG